MPKKLQTKINHEVDKTAQTYINLPNQKIDHLHPVWSFSYNGLFDYEFKITNPNNNFLGKVLPKLISLEKMTWHDIRKQTHDKGKSSSHFIDINALSDIGKKIFFDDKSQNALPTDSLFSFRLENKYRLIGFLQGGIFHIALCDKDHKIVKTSK